MISGHIAWLENSETKVPKPSIKSAFEKTSRKSYGKTSASGLFFNQVPGLKPAISLNRDPGAGVFL